MTARRMLPTVPLLAQVRLALEADDPSDSAMAAYLGIQITQVRRWRVVGWISWGKADDIATILGLHPRMIWGDAWEDLAGDKEWCVVKRMAGEFG